MFLKKPGLIYIVIIILIILLSYDKFLTVTSHCTVIVIESIQKANNENKRIECN